VVVSAIVDVEVRRVVVVLTLGLVVNVVPGVVAVVVRNVVEEVAGTVDAEETEETPPPEHPTRLELIEISSYQKVLVSLP